MFAWIIGGQKDTFAPTQLLGGARPGCPLSLRLCVEVPKSLFSTQYELQLKTIGKWTMSKVSGYLFLSVIGVKLTLSRTVVISEDNKENVKYVSLNCAADIKDVYLQDSYDSETKNIVGRIDSEDLKKQVEDRLCNGSSYLSEF